MKILLMTSEVNERQNFPKVGLTYIGTVLKNNGYEVKIVNSSLSTRLKEIAKYRPDIVGIGCMTNYFSNAIKIAKVAKKYGCIVVMGGPHASIAGEKVLSDSNFIDYCIIGEAEYSFSNLIKKLERNEPLDNIAGLIYRKNGVIIRNEPKFVENLDELPFPDYSLSDTKIIEDYPISTSRGCPFNCIFCCVHKLFGKKWRSRTSKNIIDEIIQAKNKYETKKFMIIDDDFTFDLKRVKEFCRLLILNNVNMKWLCATGIRADSFDEELAILMKKSGCELIPFGIESIDPKVFSSIKKGETLEQIKKAIEICKKVGISACGFFIVGLPNDTIESEMMSLEFAKEMGLKISKWTLAKPYPGTELYEIVSKNFDIIRETTDDPGVTLLPFRPIFMLRNISYHDFRRIYVLNNLRTGNYFISLKKNVFFVLFATTKLFLTILVFDCKRFPYYFFDLTGLLLKKMKTKFL